jgi:hypothetical protein
MNAQPVSKHIDIRAAFRDAFRWFGQRPIPLLVIAAPNLLLSVASLIVARSDLVGIGFLLSITSFFVTVIVGAALIYASYLISTGRSFGVNEMFQRATDRLGPLIAYSFRYFGAVFLIAITIVGIPWAIRVFVRWWFGTQAIVLNDESPKEAISHSCRLVSGVGWQIFWTFVLLSILFLPFIALSLVTRGAIALSVASTLFGWLSLPILSAFWTALYLQLDAQESTLTTPETAP